MIPYSRKSNKNMSRQCPAKFIDRFLTSAYSKGWLCHVLLWRPCASTVSNHPCMHRPFHPYFILYCTQWLSPWTKPAMYMPELRCTTNPKRPWVQKRPELSSLFTAGTPNWLQGKCTHVTRNHQIITGRCEPTAHTHMMQCSNKAWREGERPPEPKSLIFQADERMNWEKPRKRSEKYPEFFTAAWATGNFPPVSYTKEIELSFLPLHSAIEFYH